MKKTLLFFTLLFSIFSFSQDINMEPGVFMRCGPDMFYDSGSQFGGYGNDENIVTTICPLNSDQFTILNFNFFFTEGGPDPDVMNIYDGDDTTAPLLGTYSGPVGAFSVSATGANTSGCLTVEFISNSTQSVDGWEAEILCATACQDIDASFDSSSPEPNGAGVIGILPGDTVDFSGSALFQSDDTGATYSWDFGDGDTATGTDVSHTFLTSGTYTVTFTATDSNPQGCFDSDTVTVFVLGPNLVVDQDMFTVEELIEDVLVDSPCASVSNIIYSTGSTINPSLPSGIGYFFSDGVNFEFEDGLVLTSGDASRAGGPNGATLSDGSWAGDPDIDLLLDPGDTSNDATYIQFNFIPRGNEITFDFLMASEEYDMGGYECSYSDAFAFLLTDSAGNETNLAVIPGTTTPILVTNIHPDNGESCGGANVRYFDSYTPDFGAPISFDGRTVPFTAHANVTPNEEYTIKLVIADARDSSYDSGVFIKAGSFNLGGNLGDDITIAAGNAQCEGSEVILDTDIELANHVWYKDGVVIPGETTAILTVTEPGVYYAEFDIESVCSGSSDPIVIEFRDNPTANEAPNMVVCSETGVEEFDLTQNDDDILGVQSATDYAVTYHLTEQDAIDNVGALVSPYTNVTSPQVIWARLADVTQTCSDVTSFSISAALAPTINAVSNLELCDDDSNDGIGEFMLSDQTAILLGSQSATDFEVSYHLNATDAELGDNALPLTYTNTVNSQPIYVRVTSLADTSCYSFSAAPLFNLVVNTRALATMPANMEICDDASGDGVAIFDLASQEAAILNGQNPAVYNVSFYASLADAQSGTGALPSTYENTSSPNQQTLYARVEDPAFPSCYGTTSFDIIVNALPVLTAPTALEVCDDGTPDGLTEMDLSIKNAEITGGNASYVVSYHETLAEAELGDNPLPTLYTNTSNGQVIYARVVDSATSCSSVTSLELVVQQAPVAYTPAPLIYCDPDNDGYGIFVLSDLDTEINGGDSGLVVTYHETLTNANNGVDAIDTSIDYDNIVQDAQTLYARVESATISTDCATIVVVELIVEPSPQLVTPTALEVCDDRSADGYAVFDLTTKASEILAGQSETQYLLSYYLSEADAEAANNPISNPSNYSNTNAYNQTIWVRVEDSATTASCYKITSLELVVNPLPVLVTPPPLELCDVNAPGDEQEAFYLEDAEAGILNGQTGITLTYYQTQTDADNAVNEIVSPYVNTSNAQTIFVRAENDATGCFNTVTVTLRVDPVPSPEPNPTQIDVCDDDNDGYAEFDLEQRTLEITNNEPNVVISYHETQTDAETGVNPIVGLYTNIVANTQMIYVRSENTITGCYSLTQNTLELNVIAAPEVPTAIDPIVLCDTDNNGITQFDLTIKESDIYNGQNTSALELSYHVSAADAATGANPIVNTTSYTNTSNPQTIYVRLYNPTVGCEDVGTFDLEVNLPPVAVQPTQLSLCDDLGEMPGDEFTVFDLTQKDDEITGNNGSWLVTYYETSADAQAQTNAIADPTQYTNTSVNGLDANPQTLYAVVTDSNTGCTDMVTLTIRVLPNPTPTLSENIPDLELCDDFNTGDGVEVFDLTANEILILNGEAGVTASYYETQLDANNGTNAIPDPTQYTNIETPSQEIYVRVTRNSTGCYSLVDFTIRVHPLPEVVAVTDMIQCELFTDGIDSFDLTTKDEEVLNGQDPNQFVVSYHSSLADAEAGTNGLVSSYTNISNPQQIFVSITNVDTGCSISTQSFYIEVHEAAQANPDTVPIVYEICDDEMEIDGDPTNDSAQFDLTTMDAEVLDAQNPANYNVTYYETQEDADLKVNPLPTLYENTVNPQIIYARVDNDTPDATTGNDTSICYAVAELTLDVNPLPELILDDRYVLCIDTNGTEILAPLVIDTYLTAADYSFEWYFNGVIIPGETGPSYMPLEEGTYRVDVTDISTSTQTNCFNSASTEVIESAPPSVTIELLTQAFADNHILEATAIGIGVYEYSLDGGPWQDSGVFNNVSSGDHEITARDRNGCGLASTSKFIIDYPLYFTPNGDGNNETWNIEGVGSNAKIYIFDRYGKLLKQLSPDGNGWDGTFNGEAMPSDGYWFTIEYDEPSTGQRKEFKAHFTLKR